MPSQLDTLTQINLNDLVSAFGWEKYPLLAAILRRLFFAPAHKFANQIVGFDTAVGQIGLNEASRLFLRQHYVRDVRVYGREHVPANGPALFLSNHPGMTDTLCLFTAINRSDLNIIALNRPFLVSLNHIKQHLFYVSDDTAERMRAVRQVAAHLRDGKGALTFPAGTIEPDADIRAGARDSLERWTDSAGVFIRFAPKTKIVPVFVRSVLWDKTSFHPLTRIRKTQDGREQLAAALQLLVMVTREAKPTTIKIQFAKPILLDEVGSTKAQAIHQVILSRMRSLIQTTPEGQGTSTLES